jgi:hypothetical protein
METKTHWKKVFNKDYLGACDLEDNKDLKAVINHVEIRKIKDSNGKESESNVAILNNGLKPMILNATNCKVIKKFTKTPYIEDWNNVAIQIYIKPDVKAFGDVVEGLRIREVQPKLTKPELLPNTDQWKAAITFLKGKGSIPQITQKYELSKANEELLKQTIL